MTDFTEVYELYFRDVYRYALSLCRNESMAEEITQETFFKALNSLDRFDGKCRITVWLCQIAKNTYFSHCRKEKHLEREADTSLLPGGDCLEERLLERESAFEVHRALHALEEPYKEVFSLRTFGELSFRQIGELFGKTETWARVTYHRARLKIKEGLK
ncbi:MAG: sigma-70 family RNA polymerase sigma factor [Oscillospiraceae bacterium]|nr:sigma-70 family RNA polymerase sigma factor [Oscillospiraceae bacterium]